MGKNKKKKKKDGLASVMLEFYDFNYHSAMYFQPAMDIFFHKRDMEFESVDHFLRHVSNNTKFMNIMKEQNLELTMENVDKVLEEQLDGNTNLYDPDVKLNIIQSEPKKSKKKKKKDKKDKVVVLDDDISEATEMLKEEDEDRDIDLEEEEKVSVPVEAEEKKAEKKAEIVIDDINKNLDTLTMLLKKYVKKGTKIIAKKTKYLDYDTTTYDVKIQYPDKEWMFMIDNGSFVPGKFSVIISSEANVMVGVPIVKKYRKLLLKIFDGYYKLNMEEMITILDENYLWNHNPMNPSLDIYRIVDFRNANAMLALNKDARNKMLVNFYTIAQMIPSFNQGRYRVKKLRNQDNFILVSDEHVKIGPGSNCVIQNIEISCTDGNIQYKQIGSDAQQAA